MSSSSRPFVEARDLLLAHRTDYDTERRDIRWRRLDRFSWALDYFDAASGGPGIAEPEGAHRVARSGTP